ncbi:unnamed protein product [Effrenium voratum]|nr:unnamed protein product [Effrenium voratum]
MEGLGQRGQHRGASASLHGRAQGESIKDRRRANEKPTLPPVAERSSAEVRAVAVALERALSSYYIDQGYLSAMPGEV